MIKNNKTKAVMFLNRAIETNYKFFDKASEEPIFFSIKGQIVKSESKQEQIETEKEKTISDYLDNTYILSLF